MVLETGAFETPSDDGCMLRLLSVWQLQEAKREALTLEGDPVLCDHACLVARALVRDKKQVFDSGAMVLQTLPPKEIHALATRWAAFHRKENPGLEVDWALAEAFKDQLEGLSQSRLRWKVLRAFGALPTERRVREMAGRDYLWCALHLLLDEEEATKALCPSCRAKAQRHCCPVCGCETGEVSEGMNESFDEARYQQLKEGGAPV